MWRSIDSRGFTLMELLVAATIGVLLVLTIYMMFETNQSTFNKGEADADLQQNARVALDRMVRELRMVGFGSLPLPCTTAIQSATATSISFITDLNGDGSSEKIQYTHDSLSNPPKIKRQQWNTFSGSDCATGWSNTGGAQPLAEKITGLTFTYYDAINNPITPPVASGSLKDIRRVTITLTTSDTLPREGPRSYALRSEVTPRNLSLQP